MSNHLLVSALEAKLATTFNITSQDKLLVALSGGPDSTALLLALSEISKRLGFQLSACHVNHNLRGSAAKSDQEFCRHLCQKQSINLIEKEIEIANDQAPMEIVKSENNLRDSRYKLLEEACSESSSNVLVTGHTKDDQVETVLFRIFRGSSSYGLSGIPDKRQLTTEIALIRPLLSLNKSDCLDYLDSLGIKACIDESNDLQNYSRNFLRQSILPVLKERFPKLEENICRLQANCTIENTYFNQLIAEHKPMLQEKANTNHWNLAYFRLLPQALKGRLLAAEFRLRSIEPNSQTIQTILEKIEELALNSGVFCMSLNEDYDLVLELNNQVRRLTWLNKEIDTESFTPGDPSLEASLKIPGKTMLLKAGICINVSPWEQDEQVKRFPSEYDWQAYVDLSDIKNVPVVRVRQNKDKIQPFGMNSLVSLKHYLHTHKPEEDTRLWTYPIVVADQSEILWYPGIGLSEKLRVKDKPTHILAISLLMT